MAFMAMHKAAIGRGAHSQVESKKEMMALSISIASRCWLYSPSHAKLPYVLVLSGRTDGNLNVALMMGGGQRLSTAHRR